MKVEPELSLYSKPRRQFPRRGALIALAVVMGTFTLLLAACGGTTSLSDSDNGKSITVHVGDELDIALSSNPTTGYDWAIDKGDNSLLTFMQMNYQSSSSAIGSGGTDTFKFVAKSAGTVNLSLKYWRSFEGDKSIIRRYAVTIQIQP